MAIGDDLSDARDQAGRWLEEAPERLSFLLGLLRDVDRLRERAERAEREQRRLQAVVAEHEQLEVRLAGAEHERDRLRDELSRLRAEHEQYGKERIEVAEQLSDVMNQVLLRLRGAG